MAGLAAGPGSAAFSVAYSTLINILPTSAYVDELTIIR